MSTLTLDDTLADQAQEYARRTGTDLSVLITELLRPVVSPVRKRRTISPQVAALAGCVKSPPDFNYKTALGDALREKYL